MSNKPPNPPTHTRTRGTTPPGADRAPHGRLSEEAAPCDQPDPAASNFQYPERLPAPAQRRSVKLSEMKAGARRGAFLALPAALSPPLLPPPPLPPPPPLWQRCRPGLQDGNALGVTIHVDGWMRAGHEDRLHRRRTVDGVDRREPTRPGKRVRGETGGVKGGAAPQPIQLDR
jgi:hypothetical protein